MSNETRQAVNKLANSVLPASITPQSLGNVLTQIVDEIERKADETDPNVLTSIAYDDLVYDNPFFAMIPTGNANVELFINGYSLTGCTLSWDRTTNQITFSITGPLTIEADGELDIILGIENPAQKGTYLYSRNNVLCTKNTNNEYNTPWMYRVDTHLFSTAVEYVDQRLGSVPKHKTGDVVYITSKADYGTLRIIDWDTYKANPSNYEAIGLVVDPVKRTFLFCDLSTYQFSTTAGREKLGKYSSFDNGMETHKRARGITGSSLQNYFPVFYFLTNHDASSSGIFYPRCANVDGYFVPSLNEWEPAFKELCLPFRDDANVFGSAMDRLIAAKTGVAVSPALFFKTVSSGGSSRDSLFYSQLSTMGMDASIENTYNMICGVPSWTNDYNIATPIFGIYTEEEENA